MNSDLQSLSVKRRSLLERIRQRRKLAVAVSGGVDSGLLLKLACEALGADRVVALTLVSTLQAKKTLEHLREFRQKNFPASLQWREIVAEPLAWPAFVANPRERCYLCKKAMYQQLQIELAAETDLVLADGTNADDLLSYRPGLQAVRELGVWTPLAEVGLGKAEVRSLARQAGLVNHDLPSNSCLATRLAEGMEITEERLRLVEKAEAFLWSLGFTHCRVRLGKDMVLLELQHGHIEQFLSENIRLQVVAAFNSFGLPPVAICLTGRKGIEYADET